MPYWCNDCNSEFEEPKVYKEHHGLTEPPYEGFTVCPVCGSDTYEETLLCTICGEDIPYSKMKTDTVCIECSCNTGEELRRSIRINFSHEEADYLEERLDEVGF